jgi:hypothetical protein
MGQFIGAATQLTTLPVESTLAHHLTASTRRLES